MRRGWTICVLAFYLTVALVCVANYRRIYSGLKATKLASDTDDSYAEAVAGYYESLHGRRQAAQQKPAAPAAIPTAAPKAGRDHSPPKPVADPTPLRVRSPRPIAVVTPEVKVEKETPRPQPREASSSSSSQSSLSSESSSEEEESEGEDEASSGSDTDDGFYHGSHFVVSMDDLIKDTRVTKGNGVEWFSHPYPNVSHIPVEERNIQPELVVPDEKVKAIFDDWKARNLTIGLIGNQFKQQFPTVHYGGIESAVQETAFCLHRYGIKFFVVVPRRNVKKDYPFPIYETKLTEGARWKHWIPQIVDVIKKKKLRPDVVWTQSQPSYTIGPLLGVPNVITEHSGGRGGFNVDKYTAPYPLNLYRFVSKAQYSRYLNAKEKRKRNQVVRARTFWLNEGFSHESFAPCPSDVEPSYHLWVAGFSWGAKGKGLHLFIERAKKVPDQKFLVYGSGSPPGILTQAVQKLKNLKFKGPLHRGPQHTKAFCGALTFHFPSRLHESFGRTMVEAMSKGTPVVGCGRGTCIDIVGKEGGIATDDEEEIVDWLKHKKWESYPRIRVRNVAWARLRMENEIVGLMLKSNELFMDKKKLGWNDPENEEFKETKERWKK